MMSDAGADMGGASAMFEDEESVAKMAGSFPLKRLGSMGGGGMTPDSLAQLLAAANAPR
ncbi:hypothetical protein IFT72_11205 [Frigoribacterium sp. CFBP 8754]|uniref:hypothetical protein n=1 Tax=Frigoribacterium sp. CFBP 8754 TaxID=2775290 RepID=UPI0017805719|nr:hypothetical protein [Frigoribacterium sp. CFBP 8754]MBD8660751.1 hypothetical protein [Frigoribacterium sp. CFBP 8754]